jgi:hypothetical protein
MNTIILWAQESVPNFLGPDVNICTDFQALKKEALQTDGDNMTHM